MFTGIIEARGTIREIKKSGGDSSDGLTLSIESADLAPQLGIGDSLSVNGVCLTVTHRDVTTGIIELDVMPQTLSFTNLGELAPGDRVNLEPAMAASERFGGHTVLGHVDGVAKVIARVDEGIAERYTLKPDISLMRYIAAQGSVALDGISLTVAHVEPNSFDVAIIPHTQEATVIGDRGVGDSMNLEVDVAARYSEQLASGSFTAASIAELFDAQAADALHTDSVEDAVEAIAKGGLVVVMDDESRENEGDLIAAARDLDPQILNEMASYAKGLICMPMTAERASALELDPMSARNTDNHHTAFTVSIDHESTTTGISAFDRAATARAAAAGGVGDGGAAAITSPAEFRRPGHMFPLVARPGGVLERNGHTEATVDLVRLAKRGEVGLCCEIMAEDGSMMRRPELMAFAKLHGWPVITIAQIQQYRRAHLSVSRIAAAELPTRYGHFTIQGFRSPETGEEAVALVRGDVADADTGADSDAAPVLTRVHSECLTGDVFGSLRCDCGDQLHEALRRIDGAGRGVVIYLQQEGRGIGLLNKVRAYALQDEGADTVEANERLGLPVDSRSYELAAAILRDMGVTSVNLLTNNPDKVSQLESLGVTVAARTSLEVPANDTDRRYLETKRERMGHLLQL
ncbi:MAG: GTP cyclohydrolase II [Bifidobacteriaceae bacterium]|jgi:3,4-dihydroxy 2-butanone 4-phosphate synthase/GTP cyclohydrolase II|nr:GTP cyclohydrolase II [Bifidobacteriaceae bacterium]